MLEDLAAHFRLKTQVGGDLHISSVIMPDERMVCDDCAAYYTGI